MRNLKSILPMLAFVLAIGMSFAFTNATGDDYYLAGFIEDEGNWYPVDVNCQTTNEDCKVVLIGDETETEYIVYDNIEGEPLMNGNFAPQEIQDPRPGVVD